MASFADVNYYIYADFAPIVGGSEKVQNHADVIYGWSHMNLFDTSNKEIHKL